MKIKLKKWYYINEQFYPTLIPEEEIKEWNIEDEIDKMPTKEELEYYDGRDIKELPLVFPVYLAKDVNELLKTI